MPEPVTRAIFPFSIDDLIDVTLRVHRHEPALRRGRWRAALGLGAIAAVLALLLLTLLPTESPDARWLIPIVASLTAPALYLRLWPRLMRRAMLPALQRRYGIGPHRCDVQLTADGVHSEQLGQTGFAPWPLFDHVRIVGGDVEMLGRSVCVVRRRAFVSDDERDRFAATAAQLHAAARATTATAP